MYSSQFSCRNAFAICIAAIPPFLLTCVSAGICAQSRDSDATADAIDVLDAAIEEWRFGVEFRSHFTYRQAVVASKSDGLTGRFGTEIPDSATDKATGVFHKRGETMRFSLDYAKPPDAATPQGDVVTNYSFDGVTSGQLWLEYLPSYGEYGNTVRLSAKPESQSATLVGGPSGNAVLNPFAFGGGVHGSPLRQFAVQTAGQDPVDTSVVKTDADHLSVVMTRAKEGGSTETMRVTFWTAPSPAVIERIETVSDNPEPRQRVESVAEASEFVQCGAGMMARRVRSVAGPLVPLDSTRAVWVVHEWVSEDLGNRPPTDDDFLVSIPPSVHVVGLREPPPPGAVRTLDLTEINPDDLATDFLKPVTEQPAGETTRRPGGLFSVLITTILLLALLFCVLMRHRSRRLASETGFHFTLWR